MENQLQMRNVHDGITGDYPRVQLLTFYKPLPIPGMRHRERGGLATVQEIPHPSASFVRLLEMCPLWPNQAMSLDWFKGKKIQENAIINGKIMENLNGFLYSFP